MKNKDFIKSGIIGLAIGDALGVPVEFKPRTVIAKNPVVDMIGYGTHNQPAGTWSDDSSLAFCLAEMLCHEYNLKNLANRFVNWKEHAYWTPYGQVFDIGIATSTAINELYIGQIPIHAGGVHEHSNGNGSLMRILPLVFYIKDMPIDQRFKHIKEVSSLTHGHIRSIFSCFIYIEFLIELLKGIDKMEAFHIMQERVNLFWEERDIISMEEINKFHRILCNPINDYEIKPIYEYEEDEINSQGYVLYTLEASIWCFLRTNSYQDAVLKAVNLGDDTDTTGCVTGGLAGTYYGIDTIPEHWIKQLARLEDILSLCERLNKKLSI